MFKQAWQKCKRYQVTDLVKITSQEFNIRKQCLEQDNNMLQDHIIVIQRHDMNLLKAYNKSPLLTISEKGSEDMMAPM